MTINRVYGKALVVLTDHLAPYPHVRLFIQSASGGLYASDCLQELTGPIYLPSLLSKRQRAMPEGTIFRIAVTLEIQYFNTYYGEGDSELYILKTRTLREQLPTRKKRKKWKLHDKTANSY